MKSISLKNILSSIKNLGIAKEFRTISDKAHHDWKYMILGTFIAGSILLIACFLLFIRVSSGEVFIVSEEIKSDETSFDKKSLESVLIKYREKAKSTEQSGASTINLQDPSI